MFLLSRQRTPLSPLLEEAWQQTVQTNGKPIYATNHHKPFLGKSSGSRRVQ
jgi:hypothetical protein